MSPLTDQNIARRYQRVVAEKAHGATYTPDNLARFVAERIVESAALEGREAITILDPAIGDGVLVLALLDALKGKTSAALSVRGFDTNVSALDQSARRIRAAYPNTRLELTRGNFLDFALQAYGPATGPTLFSTQPTFNLIIANPPYVRTQIMGSAHAQHLAGTLGLSGRVDLYQAFLLGMAQVLTPDGAAGIIVSNRFMTTKGGGTLRSVLRRRFDLRQIWDLGDSKLFDAAVLPAVLVARGTASISAETPRFTSIYEVKDDAEAEATVPASDPVEALALTGVVAVADGRRFRVRHGILDASGDHGDVWRLASASSNEWLATANHHTWRRFGEIGKIRVGVKTCADNIFIRHDWSSAFGAETPELLRPLTTHHGAGRFRATVPKKIRAILYPHEVVQGTRRAIPLQNYPKSRAYLEAHRTALESRSYVIMAGRRWYEIWVPQNPQAWSAPKLVFRDISARPTFWIDLDGSVVNGDCYWLATDRDDDTSLLWLACAVANSTFAESFYDHCFNNKLYAGRRRFITQYVEQFPLPDPALPLSQTIIARAKAIYEANHASQTNEMERELDHLVWQAFGLQGTGIARNSCSASR